MARPKTSTVRSKKKPKKVKAPDRLPVSVGKYILERTAPDLKHIVDVQELAFEEVGAYVCAGGWSATVFTGNRHKKTQFLQHGGVLALDFDSGLTLKEAKRRFGEYRHIIGLTKSHQKTKNPGSGSEKPACDRFRVLLFSDRPAESIDELEATNRSVFSWNSEADKTCLHAAKVWSPCSEIVVEKIEGKLVAISAPAPVLPAVPGRSSSFSGGDPGPAARAGIDLSLDAPAPVAALPQTKIYQAASSFLRATRPSVSGDHAHDRLFRAASVLVKEFMIEGKEAEQLIWKHFNPRCTSADGSAYPWSLAEIRHKVVDAKKATKHIYGHGVKKDWDVRWRCCPALSNLLDAFQRGEKPNLAGYAPGIEEHARAALKRRWLGSKTKKQKVDLLWFGDLHHFLQNCPHQELTANFILENAFRIEEPTRGQKTRLGKVMAALRWKSKRSKTEGQVYIRP